jgi:hypothetical protein
MAKLTIFTSQNPLTKKFWADGRKETGPPFSKGMFEVQDVEDHTALKALIESLNHNQALCYSTPLELTSGTIVTKGHENERSGIISRTNEYFDYPNGQGWLFIDQDEDLNEEEIVTRLATLYEPFGSTTYVYATSASHGIRDKRGFHLYFKVEDISIVRQAMNNLFNRAFNAGYGYCRVYDSGSSYDRTFFDNAVYLQTGLDFIAGPICVDFPEPPRDIRVVQKVNSTLDLGPLLVPVNASEAIKEERWKVRTERKEKTAKAAKEKGMTTSEYKALINGGTLHPGTKLHLEDGSELDVAEILKKSSEAYFNGETINDLPIQHPVEQGLEEKTKLFFNTATGIPRIHSYAHGGQIWNLLHTEESFDQLTGGTTYQRNSLRHAHNLSPLETDNRLPLHDKTNEVFEMMKITFEEMYPESRILELQWKEQISLYLHMILEGHRGRYSIELGMGSGKSQVILNVILYLYREGYQFPLAVAFEKIKEINENYFWLIGRMSEIWKSKSEAEIVLQFPEEYLKRRHSQERTSMEDIQNTPIIFHTHHAVRKEDFVDSFFSYKGERRHLFIYDEALPTGLELSVKVREAIWYLDYIISGDDTGDIQGLPFNWLTEIRGKLVNAQRRLNDNTEIPGIEISNTQLPERFIRTGYNVDNEKVASFIVTLFQIGASDAQTLQVSREKNGNAFMGFKANQTVEIDRLINTDASRTIRKVHEYSSAPIEKYNIPEWSGDERGSITIVPFRYTGSESVMKEHAWHLSIINEWQEQIQSNKLLICASKGFPHIKQGCRQGMLRGIPYGLKHDNVSFTTWGQHKQTNEFRDCDGIVALHYFRKPYFAYKNSIYAEQGHFSSLSNEAVRDVEYGSIVEAIQQLFGRGTKRLGKKCDCLLFASTVNEAEEMMQRLSMAFPLDDITFFKRPEWLLRFEQSMVLPRKHTGGSKQVWNSPKESQWAKDFKRAAEDAGYEYCIELALRFVADRREDSSITPKKWLKANM